LIEQLYSSTKRTGKLRSNYLLLSVYEGILAAELKLNTTLDDVDLSAGEEKEMMSTFIFNWIFD
jgi:hypothetical protein